MKSRRGVLFAGVVFFLFYFSVFSPVFGDEAVLSLENLNSFFEQGKHLHEEGESGLKNLENACINNWPKVASRNGRVLQINTGDFSTSFKDVGDNGEESSKYYYFIHYFPQFEVAMVYRGENTWEAFHLISQFGDVEIPGLPVFSKSGEKALSSRSCEMNGNDFVIVKFEKGKILEELSLLEKDFEGFSTFASPCWLSDDSIEIRSQAGQWNSEKENPNWVKKKMLLNFDQTAREWRKTIISEIVKEDEGK